MTLFQKLTLAAAGLTALGIGGAILAAPLAFYRSYGIALPQDPNLLSELRAPAAGLVVLGGVILAGLLRATMEPVARAAALIVFLGWPAGRLVGLIVDGVPSASILGAFGVEVTIAILLVIALRPAAQTSRPRRLA